MKKVRHAVAGIMFGLLLILLGVGIFGSAMGWWGLIGFSGWWTLLIMIPAVFFIIEFGFHFWNVLILGVGVLLLLKEQKIIESRMFWPIAIAGLIVFWGIEIVIWTVRKKPVCSTVSGFPPVPNDRGRSMDYSSNPQYSAVFSSINVKSAANPLMGGEISAAFGYAEIDLTEVVVNGDVVIETSAVFGAVRIFAPRNYRVKVDSSAVFGGCDNKCATLTDPALPLITIKASTVFGGTEIL